ncbi:signal transduction histidine kinase [Catalinimonas alkaloidigena]|uniref:sensor histidine kinase n=1 Tax=Catalinimonas alkaloidigena TaxID=1075417 RepID=UPI0024051CAA|nr:HAMP domain-containing sensor histidine kinase [Catalinimonas alkaloidigena]MDF9801392.1 signal transduction histidine kinase [Catalinimonas alkaloidigena]
MKLLNYTSSYFIGLLLIIISVWAIIFYFVMLDEIYDSIDDGLQNSKILIIQKAANDSTVLYQSSFQEGNYAIRKISPNEAITHDDTYQDTTLYMFNEEDYEPVRMLRSVFLLDQQYYELSIITSMVEEDDLIEDLLYAILWLYLGLVASMIVLNNLLLQRIWQPFYKLLRYLERFQLDRPESVRIQKTQVEEFNILNDTISKLLQSNINVYNQQKQFIENASHELQTPLAISLNKLELIIGKNDLTETQLTGLMTVINNLERLTRMNKSLLLLSKIENRQFQDVEKVSVDKLVKNLCDDFKDQADFREIEFSLQIISPCEKHMNPELARIMISNLFKNAIVHNTRGGLISINVNYDGFSISNTGIEEPLDSGQIFERFYKNNTRVHSTGLGMAIVKSIASLYDITIQYSYRQQQHHFNMRL